MGDKVSVNYDDMRDALLDVIYDYEANDQPLNEAALNYVINTAFNDKAVYIECSDGERHVDHGCSSIRAVRMLPGWRAK